MFSLYYSIAPDNMLQVSLQPPFWAIVIQYMRKCPLHHCFDPLCGGIEPGL